MGIFKTFLTALQIKGEKVKNIGNVVQNDVGSSVFVLRLSDGNKPVDISDYDIITVTVIKPDKTVCVDSTPTDRIEVTDAENGEISINLHDNAIDVAGICTATVEVYDGERKMSSARFTYTVTPDLANGADPTGNSSFPVLQNLVSQVSSVLAKETAKVTVLDMFTTLNELQTAHPKGTPGDAYIVGTSASNEVYIWSESKGDWVSIGDISNGMKLLWVNPDSSAEFSFQTLGFDLNGCRRVRIRYKGNDGVTYYTEIDVGCVGVLSIASGVNYIRKVTVSNTSVLFEHAYRYSGYSNWDMVQENAQCIPLEIYGIK